VRKGLEQLTDLDHANILARTPFAEWINNIDWLSLSARLEAWLKEQSGNLAGHAMGAAGSVVSGIAAFAIGLFFQFISYLLRVWPPDRVSGGIIHVTPVCASTFKLFIAGQATEATILGTLRVVGMVILRLSYAPMIGALGSLP